MKSEFDLIVDFIIEYCSGNGYNHVFCTNKLNFIGFKNNSPIRGSVNICKINEFGEIIEDNSGLNLEKILKLKEFL